MSRALGVLLGIALAAAAWLGLSGALSPAATVPAAAEATRPAPGSPSPGPQVGEAPAPPRLRCPARVARCASVTGEVLLVESVDPDGDGDLHVVLAGGGVTGPGVTAVDIRPGLRPQRDPEVGDVVRAAGPVQRGSFGQDQIHALAVRFSR